MGSQKPIAVQLEQIIQRENKKLEKRINELEKYITKLSQFDTCPKCGNAKNAKGASGAIPKSGFGRQQNRQGNIYKTD